AKERSGVSGRVREQARERRERRREPRQAARARFRGARMDRPDRLRREPQARGEARAAAPARRESEEPWGGRVRAEPRDERGAPGVDATGLRGLSIKNDRTTPQ